MRLPARSLKPNIELLLSTVIRRCRISSYCRLSVLPLAPRFNRRSQGGLGFYHRRFVFPAPSSAPRRTKLLGHRRPLPARGRPLCDPANDSSRISTDGGACGQQRLLPWHCGRASSHRLPSALLKGERTIVLMEVISPAGNTSTLLPPTLGKMVANTLISSDSGVGW